MLGPHPTNSMWWRQAMGTVGVQLHCNWIPSSYQTSWNTSGDACPESATIQKRQRILERESRERMSTGKVVNRLSMWYYCWGEDLRMIHPVLHGLGLTSIKPYKRTVTDVSGVWPALLQVCRTMRAVNFWMKCLGE